MNSRIPGGRAPMAARIAAEAALHGRAVDQLSEQLHVPAHVVKEVYDDVLTGLAPRAAVRDYLPIFVARRVRTLFAGRLC